jgi:hypothetical protein
MKRPLYPADSYVVERYIHAKPTAEAVLKVLAPFFKLCAVLLIFPTLFVPLMGIAVVGSFALSMLLSAIKLRLYFRIDYVLRTDGITIIKNFDFLNPKTLLNCTFAEIFSCELVPKPQPAQTKAEEVVVKLALKDGNTYNLEADLYMYSKITVKIDNIRRNNYD